ncbi:hypothetical protein BT69DRAFT_1277526, partial [Atractiella rhizophila]
MADGERGGQSVQCGIKDHKWTSRLVLLVFVLATTSSLSSHNQSLRNEASISERSAL